MRRQRRTGSASLALAAIALFIPVIWAAPVDSQSLESELLYPPESAAVDESVFDGGSSAHPFPSRGGGGQCAWGEAAAQHGAPRNDGAAGASSAAESEGEAVRLEELRFVNVFTSELPADPLPLNTPRQVGDTQSDDRPALTNSLHALIVAFLAPTAAAFITIVGLWSRLLVCGPHPHQQHTAPGCLQPCCRGTSGPGPQRVRPPQPGPDTERQHPVAGRLRAAALRALLRRVAVWRVGRCGTQCMRFFSALKQKKAERRGPMYTAGCEAEGLRRQPLPACACCCAAGQLGDGRAISLGQVAGPDGTAWEVQLKVGPAPALLLCSGKQLPCPLARRRQSADKVSGPAQL